MSAAIEFLNVSKKYRVGRSLPNLRNILMWRNKKQKPSYHWAIRDLSFKLRQGESLGIIGPNGAGKTTVLKLLSKVTHPTDGEILINGRFSALIELGAGFHPDLTGRENVFLNGVILGLTHSEIRKRFDRIVDFAGIEEYLDTPVKRYSSGMYARLGFAVAAHVDPEIMLVDEVLAVGDMAFRQKCYERMINLMKNGTSLVFVSHDFAAIQKVCTRSLVLYRGKMAFDGTSVEAVAQYSNLLRKASSGLEDQNIPQSGALSQMVMTQKAVIEDVQMVGENNLPAYTFSSGERIKVRIRVKFHEVAQKPIFACSVRQPDGQIIYNYTTHWADQVTPNFEANSTAVIEFALKLNLIGGTYYLGTDLAYADLSCYYDRIDRVMDFVVVPADGARGIADLQCAFRVLETNPEENFEGITRA
jgi:lipopolysaccharide transport system ATP-binding protein